MIQQNMSLAHCRNLFFSSRNLHHHHHHEQRHSHRALLPVAPPPSTIGASAGPVNPRVERWHSPRTLSSACPLRLPEEHVEDILRRDFGAVVVASPERPARLPPSDSLHAS